MTKSQTFGKSTSKLQQNRCNLDHHITKSSSGLRKPARFLRKTQKGARLLRRLAKRYTLRFSLTMNGMSKIGVVKNCQRIV